MAKAKKALSMLLVVLMTMFTFMSYVPAKAASILPEVKFVGLENIPAAVGEEQTLMLTSNYTGDVQYRVFYLQRDDASKKQVEGWKSLGDWTPAADAKTPVEVKVPAGTITKAGNYSFAVRVKIAGTEGTYSNNYGGYDSAYAFNYVFAAEATEGLKAAKLEKNEVVAGEKFVISGLKAGESYRLFTLNENRAQRWDKDPVATSVTDKIEWAPAEAGNYVLDLQIMKDGKVDAVKLFNVKVAPKPAELKVESVSATNLKEAVVKFNIPVDKDTVVDGNFKVVDKNGNSVKTTAILADDNTVVLTNDSKFDNQASYKLTVANLKSADGIKLEKTEKEFTAFDRELPEVKDIKVTGPRSFVVAFSEPMNSANPGNGTIEVKSGNSVIGVAPVTAEDFKSNKVAINLYSSLEDGKTYTITVKDFEDYAGYKNVLSLEEIKYVKDNNAPTATVVKTEQTYVVVKFDKPVKGLTPAHFYHTFSAWTANNIYSDAEMKNAIKPTDSVDTVYVDFYSKNAEGKLVGYPIAEGTTKLVIRDKASDNSIVDNWSNKFVMAELPISVVADKEVPQVKALTVKDEQTLKVTFTKNVTFTKDNVEVLDKDGKKIDGVKIAVTPAKVAKEFEIALGKDLTGETIIVNFKNIEDTALTPNKLATYTSTLEITDKTAPEIDKITYKDEVIDGKNVGSLFVFYKEDVDAETALNVENYYFVKDNKYTQLTGDASFFNGAKIVKITLDEEEIKMAKEQSIFVTNVKDIAKNTMAGQYVAAISDNKTNTPGIAKAVAKDINTVEVTFDQYLTRVEKDVFAIKDSKDGGKTYTITSMTLSTNSDNHTVATLTVKEDLPYDVETAEKNVEVSVTTDTTKIHNEFGVSVAAGTKMALKDKVAPAIVKDGDDLKVKAVAGNTIEITFTEALDPASLSKYTFSVKDNTVTKVALKEDDPTVIVITVKTALNEKDELAITQEQSLCDILGNNFKYDKAIEVIVAK